MSTFAQIAARAGITCRANISSLKKKGVGDVINLIKLAREAENRFIELSECHDTFTQLDTSALNGGVLTNLYDLPTGFVRDLQVKWKGIPLKPIHQKTEVRIYNSSNELIDGLPRHYWIQSEQIQLIPKPSSHDYISIWYILYNTSTAGASPIIPALEHNKLRNYVIGMVKEADGDLPGASYYIDRFESDASLAKERYEDRRNKQKRILDVTEGEIFYPRGDESRVPLVSE
jgi:hypothetical protein